jgi:hypothetical protein
LSPGATSSAMGPEACYATASELAAEIPSSQYTIGFDYMNTNYGGTSLQWTGGAPCSSNLGYGASSMPSGWNDDISSASSNWSNCNDWRHFENTDYNKKVNGAVIDCSNNNCYYIGNAMNDRTSSETWNT